MSLKQINARNPMKHGENFVSLTEAGLSQFHDQQFQNIGDSDSASVLPMNIQD